MLNNKRFIFVTGHPRSGTTFVGKMLAIPKNVQYFTEPFNPQYGMPDVEDFYVYISQHPDQRAKNMMHLINDFYAGKAKFKKLDPKKSSTKKQYIGRKLFGTKNNLEYKNFFYNPAVTHGIIKDPTACLSTSYIASQKATPAIIIIRHPAAVIGSAKRLGWNFTPQRLIKDKELYKDYGASIFKKYDVEKLPNVQKQALHWLVINQVLLDTHNKLQNTLLLTHETISLNPVETFSKMYDFCDIKFSDKTKNKISASTASSNPASAPGNAIHHLERDSKSNIKGYKKILTAKEIDQIKEITYDFASQFYDEESWI